MKTLMENVFSVFVFFITRINTTILNNQRINNSRLKLLQKLIDLVIGGVNLISTNFYII